MACFRDGKREASCLISFNEKSSPPVTSRMTVDIETTPMTVLTANNAADYVVIRPGMGVVSTTRLLDEKFLATKTCFGTYVTADEAKLLRAREQRKRNK